MKIEEAAIDYCRNMPNGAYNEKDVFKAGVEFAQRWIAVSEELPPENELVQTKCHYPCEGLLYYNHQMFLGMDSDEGDEFPVWSESDEVTHWRKIELT